MEASLGGMDALLAPPSPADAELARHQAALHELVKEAAGKLGDARVPAGGRPRSASMSVGRLSFLLLGRWAGGQAAHTHAVLFFGGQKTDG